MLPWNFQSKSELAYLIFVLFDLLFFGLHYLYLDIQLTQDEVLILIKEHTQIIVPSNK